MMYATSLRTFVVIFTTTVLASCSGDAAEREPSDPGAPGTPDIQQVNTQPEMAAVEFGTMGIQVRADEKVVEMRVDVAERPDQRAFGLMDRDSLPLDGGMIFLYDDLQPGNSGFWMYRTRIPLDIAFFDGAGRITAIRQMQPCTSSVPAECQMQARDYYPGQPYAGALEANLGFFARHGIDVGDWIIVPGRIGD